MISISMNVNFNEKTMYNGKLSDVLNPCDGVLGRSEFINLDFPKSSEREQPKVRPASCLTR